MFFSRNCRSLSTSEVTLNVNGTEISVPIINRPQVGILSTDGVRKRVVAAGGPEGDRLAIRPTGYLCLSFDHRAIDGAYAGAFAGRVRDILEGRDWLTEL